MEFIGRLAALVPRPRANLARFHGVFSRGGLPYNSKLREHVEPQKPVEEQEDPKPKAYSRRGPIEKFKVSINEDVALESRGVGGVNRTSRCFLVRERKETFDHTVTVVIFYSLIHIRHRCSPTLGLFSFRCLSSFRCL
jgi:hypothetical protein